MVRGDGNRIGGGRWNWPRRARNVVSSCMYAGE